MQRISDFCRNSFFGQLEIQEKQFENGENFRNRTNAAIMRVSRKNLQKQCKSRRNVAKNVNFFVFPMRMDGNWTWVIQKNWAKSLATSSFQYPLELLNCCCWDRSLEVLIRVQCQIPFESHVDWFVWHVSINTESGDPLWETHQFTCGWTIMIDNCCHCVLVGALVVDQIEGNKGTVFTFSIVRTNLSGLGDDILLSFSRCVQSREAKLLLDGTRVVSGDSDTRLGELARQREKDNDNGKPEAVHGRRR